MTKNPIQPLYNEDDFDDDDKPTHVGLRGKLWKTGYYNRVFIYNNRVKGWTEHGRVKRQILTPIDNIGKIITREIIAKELVMHRSTLQIIECSPYHTFFGEYRYEHQQKDGQMLFMYDWCGYEWDMGGMSYILDKMEIHSGGDWNKVGIIRQEHQNKD